MPSAQDLLIQRQLEGERLRQALQSAGQQILPQQAANQLQQQQTLPASNLANRLAGNQLQLQQIGRAQNFLAGGQGAPVDVATREGIEANRTNDLRAAFGRPGGQGGQLNQARTDIDVAASVARANAQQAANDRLFQRLGSNLNPTFQPTASSVTSDAISASLGGQGGVSQLATIEQKRDQDLLAAISSITENVARLFL